MSVLSSIKAFFSPKKSPIDFRPSLFRDRDKLRAELHDEMFHDNGTFDEQMDKMMARMGPPSKVPSLPSGVVSSGFTKDTLKQALDDAKNVRATALKNAQQALTSAFDIHGVKPANAVYKPGFKITVHDDFDDIGDFEEDLDMSMGLSGFTLNSSLPNKNGNSYNSITLTGSIPPSSIQFNSFYGGTKPVSSISDPIPKKDPLDKLDVLDDFYKNGLPQPPFGKVFYDEFLDKKDDGSGAVDKQPDKIRTGKIARVEFDVVFGRPQWSNQIHAIKNSGGKEIYLASNHGIVKAAVNAFNDKLKEMYGDKTPVFTIEGGTMFRTGLIDEAHPILSFRGLRFPNNGAKITAVFSYDCELNRKTDIDVIKKDIELIGTSCQFFVLGELELTEDEESITDMVFESFGYNNPHRMNINKELFRIL